MGAILPTRSGVGMASAWARRARFCHARGYWRGAPLPTLRRVALRQHKVRSRACQPGLQERLVLAAFIKTLGRLHCGKLEDHKSVDRKIAFEPAHLAATHEILPA